MHVHTYTLAGQRDSSTLLMCLSIYLLGIGVFVWLVGWLSFSMLLFGCFFVFGFFDWPGTPCVDHVG